VAIRHSFLAGSSTLEFGAVETFTIYNKPLSITAP
jgi:hypothetical protein